MSMDGMFNIQDIDEKVTVGNGNKMVATKVGILRLHVIQLDGSTLDIVINKVKYLPDLWANLFSVNKAIKNGFDLSNEGEREEQSSVNGSSRSREIASLEQITVKFLKTLPLLSTL
jgi:hypothetical protein